MPASTLDILTDEDAVQGQVESIIEQRKVMREAFRPVDLSNANSDTVYFVVPSTPSQDLSSITEGAEFPRDMSGRSKVSCKRAKWGEEFAITMEAERDGYLDDIAIEADTKMERLGRTLDAQAYAVLDANKNATTISSAGTLSYSNVVDAETELLSAGYEPTALFVGAQGMGDLKQDSNFIHATEAGDRTIREGKIGSIIGLDVFLSTSGDLGAGEAFLVDQNVYGREGVWQDAQTRAYEEESNQVSVMQMWTMMGWCSTRSDAAVKIVV